MTLDNLHIPMIDTDECSLSQIIDEIRNMQEEFHLGTASVCSTGRRNSFHVYFWNKMSWRDAVKVVASCKNGDLKHLQFSLRRGHFTLRISPKKDRSVKQICKVFSSYSTTASLKDLKSFVTYETASKLGLMN